VTQALEDRDEIRIVEKDDWIEIQYVSHEAGFVSILSIFPDGSVTRKALYCEGENVWREELGGLIGFYNALRLFVELQVIDQEDR
jgi:hypothetical protein